MHRQPKHRSIFTNAFFEYENSMKFDAERAMALSVALKRARKKLEERCIDCRSVETSVRMLEKYSLVSDKLLSYSSV